MTFRSPEAVNVMMGLIGPSQLTVYKVDADLALHALLAQAEAEGLSWVAIFSGYAMYYCTTQFMRNGKDEPAPARRPHHREPRS